MTAIAGASTALAPIVPRYRRPLVRPGSGTTLQTMAGSVLAFFALEHFDRRRGVAMYALRVVNRTASALVCRTWVVSRGGDMMLAHPILVEVAPLSTSTAKVPIWPGDFTSFERAIAEIAGDGVHCIVEAPAPPRRRPQRTLAIAAGATLVAGLMLLGSAAALRAALPKIDAFALAPQTLAGTTIRAEYAVSGTGDLAYAVVAPDGRQIQSGPLQQRSGTIPIAIPASNESGAYTVQLTMDGPLGTAGSTRVLNTLVTKGSQAAQINDVWVKPMVAKPGDTLDVGYSADGDGGYVRLTGSDGTIWAQQPFARSGETQLVVPPVANAQEMRVVLHVTKAGTTAQLIAGVVVAADPPAATSPPSQAATPIPDGNGIFQVLEGSVPSGGSIHVRIISPRNGMHIALTDAQSHEVSGVDVGAEAEAVTLRAPIVTTPTRYTVVASFTDGFGQESIVQPVTVLP
jgi:hypothetical protein